MATIKGLKVTSTITNPSGGPDYVDVFFRLGSHGQISPGADGASLNFYMQTDPFYDEAAFDSGSQPLTDIPRGYMINVTDEELKGTTVRNDMYNSLKDQLEADGMTVEVVNEA